MTHLYRLTARRAAKKSYRDPEILEGQTTKIRWVMGAIQGQIYVNLRSVRQKDYS